MVLAADFWYNRLSSAIHRLRKKIVEMAVEIRIKTGKSSFLRSGGDFIKICKITEKKRNESPFLVHYSIGNAQ